MSTQPIDRTLLMMYASTVIPRLEDDRVSIHPGIKFLDQFFYPHIGN